MAFDANNPSAGLIDPRVAINLVPVPGSDIAVAAADGTTTVNDTTADAVGTVAGPPGVPSPTGHVQTGTQQENTAADPVARPPGVLLPMHPGETGHANE